MFQINEGVGVGIGIVVIILILILSFGGLAFWIWMLVDAATTPEGWFKSGSKTTWILVVALVSWLGALIYFFAGRPEKATREQLKQYKAAGVIPPPPGYGYGQPPPGYGYGQPPQPPAPGPGWGGPPS